MSRSLLTVVKPKKRRRDGAGYSLPAAAEELGVSYKTLLDAVQLGHVKAFEFGKLRRVSKAEIERIKRLFEAGS